MQDCSTGQILFYSTNAGAVINHAIGNLTSGGTIFIKAGTYTFTTAPIIFGSQEAAIGSTSINNIELYGEGNATILSAGTNLNAGIIGVYGVKNWYIHDLQIDGNRANQNNKGNGNTPLVGIDIFFGSNNVIEHCFVHDDKTYGIQAWDTGSLKILNNWIINNNANGILTSGGSDILVQGNMVNGASDVGISMGGSKDQTAYSLTCEDNTVENVNLGISPFGTLTGVGIYIGDMGAVTQATVIGNVVFDISDEGIFTSATFYNQDLTIANNVIYDSVVGLSIGKGSDTTITGNVISNIYSATSGLAGVTISDTASTLTFSGNTIRDVTTPNGYGITDSSPNSVIEDNIIDGTQKFGITAYNANGITISGNRLTNPDEVGNYAGYGVDLHGSSSYCTVSNNVISLYDPSTDWAILVENTASYNQITDNTFVNTGRAVNINNGANNVANQITGNNILAKAGRNMIINNSTIAENNTGYNPIGNITNPVFAGGSGSGDGTWISPMGTSHTLAASTTYTDTIAPVTITIYTCGGATISINSGPAFTPTDGESLTLYPGDTINFGAFGSSTPTVQFVFQ